MNSQENTLMPSVAESICTIPHALRAAVSRFGSPLTTLSLLVAATACGAPEESRTGNVPVCESGGTVNPRSGLREFRDCPYGPYMVELPPGRFLMGSPDGEEAAALHVTRPAWTETLDKPQVEVEISYPFAIGKYEVTFAEWDLCVEDGGCTYRPKGRRRGDRPVVYVSRVDAEQYVDWLSETTGQQYRLPSEEEWEYAARAGTTTARYWGDEIGEGMAVCDGCGSRWDKRSTVPVGSFPSNAFGLHEMLGNAEEWTADCWSPDHSDAPRDGSVRPGHPSSWRDGECVRPVKRGGSYATYTWAVRAASRSSWRPGPWSDREYTYGFRMVRDITATDEASRAVPGGNFTDPERSDA
jgi:formylglycine-generating enzyme required for sulfatase activity